MYLQKHMNIEVAQDRPRKIALAHRNMAVIFTLQNKFEQARSSLNQAISIRLTFEEDADAILLALRTAVMDVKRLEAVYIQKQSNESEKIPPVIVENDDPVVQEYEQHFKKKQNLPNTCDGCKCRKKMQDMSQCSICKEVLYCSKGCQKKHWKEHKKVCQSYW
jgi:hypothetical protein